MFFARFLANPRAIGAVAPSGVRLARLMAAQVPLDGNVLELGPGTGVFTAALIERGVRAQQITAIEHDAVLARRMRTRFPQVRVIQGDAFAAVDLAGSSFAAVVSGLPLLNFPRESGARLIADLLETMSPDAPFVQFSYGLMPPVTPTGRLRVRRGGTAWRNLPPARVWVYTLA